jgi:hypothetical protein
VLRRLGRTTGLSVEDLLEHLAHARPHEGAMPCVRVVISAPDPLRLPGIELILGLGLDGLEDEVGGGIRVVPRSPGIGMPLVHDGIVSPWRGLVNRHSPAAGQVVNDKGRRPR